jgi:hypothetical protein
MTSLAYLYTVLAQVWAMASLTSCTVGITLACTVGIPNPGNEWASLTLATSGHHSPWQRVGITHPGNEWASLTLATSGHHSPDRVSKGGKPDRHLRVANLTGT